MVRGSLILDLALCGALTHVEDAVELDHDRAAAQGLARVAAEADEGDSSLLHWLDWGAFGFDEWAVTLVGAGVWHTRPWSLRYPMRTLLDSEWQRTDADRAAGRAAVRAEGTSRQALAVLAIGSVSGLFGRIAEPAGWVLGDLGDARWAGELVLDRLTELRVRMRAIGRAVD